LFFGTDPTVWLQKHFYSPHVIHWYDKVASCAYFSHFIFPIIAIAVLWVTSHHQWARFMKRFATLLFIACILFIVLPTAPPWMASSQYHLLPASVANQRSTGRGFAALGLKGFVKTWESALDWGNAIAAFPSLHASFALFDVAFFLPWIKPKWLKAVLLTFPVIMLTSLVYFGEHYVVDGLCGWLIVAGSFWFWGRQEKRTRMLKANKARTFFAPSTPAMATGNESELVAV
jgi:membrane-associated phospholipid phosphatase